MIVDRVGVIRTANINYRNDYSDRKRERNWDSPRRIVGFSVATIDDSRDNVGRREIERLVVRIRQKDNKTMKSKMQDRRLK